LRVEAVGAHFELVGRFLTTDIEDFLLRETEHGLEGEGGFADARFSA
jgi:hypothetical protein